MVMAHLWPSPFHQLLRLRAFWSGAEGFFLISGAVVGIFCHRRIGRVGLATATQRLWRRAGVLWLANFAVALLWLARDLWRLSPAAFDRVWGDPWWPSLFHLDQPYLLHVLPRYTVFLLATPAALALLRRRQTAWVLVASLGLWCAGLADWRDPGLPWLEPGQTHFPIISWQLLFFGGLLLGWHRQRLARWWSRVAGWPLAVALALGVASLQALRLAQLATGQAIFTPEILWLGRTVLGPLRCVALVFTFGLAFLLVDRLWQPLERWTGGLLLVLGRNALYVYLLHMLFVMAFHPLPRHLPGVTPIGWLAADLAVLAALWALARYRPLIRQRVWGATAR